MGFGRKTSEKETTWKTYAHHTYTNTKEFFCNPSSEKLWVTLQPCTKLNILCIQQEMQVSVLSLNRTSLYRQNKLQVSASDSHCQADHILIKKEMFTAALVFGDRKPYRHSVIQYT